MRRARTLVVVVAAALGLLLVAAPAGAGGSSLRFEREWYAVGEVARATGTVSWTNSIGRGWLDSGPYFAYLTEGSSYHEATKDGSSYSESQEGLPTPKPLFPQDAIQLGEVSPAPGAETPIRVFNLEFVVPEVAPGWYTILICNAGCNLILGDLLDPVVHIADPASPPAPGAQPPWWPSQEVPEAVAPVPPAAVASPTPSADVREPVTVTKSSGSDEGIAPVVWWAVGGALLLLGALVGFGLARRARAGAVVPTSDLASSERSRDNEAGHVDEPELVGK